MLRAYGLYSHIQRNRRVSVLLLASFMVLLQALSFSFALLFEAYRGGTVAQMIARAGADMRLAAPAGLFAASIWFLISLAAHQKMIDAATGARDFSRAAAPDIYARLENLCISRGMKTPRLKIIETPALNAFASGMNVDESVIGLTRGLVDTLNDDEIEAVLAHELTHIRNRDAQTMVIAVIFAGFFGFVADLVARNWDFPLGRSPRRSSSKSKDSGAALVVVALAVTIILLSWGLSTLARLALSRSREYLADAGAVELTKNPDALISALRKISGNPNMPDMPSRMAGFFIENPAPTPRDSWLATHPALQSRVDALVRYAGGRAPLETAPASAPTSPWA